MNYTDTQLKQALAKMLPDDIKWSAGFGLRHRKGECCNLAVLDTELLHLCWLVETSLTNEQWHQFNHHCIEDNVGIWSEDGMRQTLNWQEKAFALAKVKGIEIV